MSHQLRGVQIAQKHPHYGFFWDPGCGKSILILAVVDDERARDVAKKTLVLAPKSILRSAWLGDARHFPLLRVSVVWSDKPAERRRLIDAPADILITNYETFRKYAADFLAAGVRRLVIDESSKIKSPTSQITKGAIAFADKMESVYLLSGTPAPNNSTEYFSQMRCVDRTIFGPSYWRFCYEYFSPVKRMIQGRERIIGWKALPNRREEFLERLRSRSWSLQKAECLDLPPQTDIIREVELSPRETVAYVTMLEELRVELGDGSVLSAAMQARLMKLRQITGGQLYNEGTSVVLGDSKLRELVDLLDELAGHPVVIWAEFTAEINRIVAALEGKAAAVIDGSTPLDARTNAIERFQAGGLQYLVCHPAAAGHGVTLTAASYDVFYSHSFSFETYEQARNRIHRKGQTRPVTHYHLIAPGTIDERLWWALRNKKGGHEAVMQLLKDPVFKKSQ